jgi:hypothetical protein
VASRDEQDDAADQGDDPHDGVEYDGVGPLHIHFERTSVHDSIRSEEGDALEEEGADAEHDEHHADDREKLHGVAPLPWGDARLPKAHCSRIAPCLVANDVPGRETDRRRGGFGM